MTRAERRAQSDRAKARARRQFAIWNQHDPDEKAIGRVARTRKPCSCRACGNQRRFEGPPARELRHMQEQDMGRHPEDGEYYTTKTLLDADPDTNRRLIYCWPEGEPVCVFNSRMRPWTHADEMRLRVVLDALNKTRKD